MSNDSFMHNLQMLHATIYDTLELFESDEEHDINPGFADVFQRALSENIELREELADVIDEFKKDFDDLCKKAVDNSVEIPDSSEYYDLLDTETDRFKNLIEEACRTMPEFRFSDEVSNMILEFKDIMPQTASDIEKLAHSSYALDYLICVLDNKLGQYADDLEDRMKN